jgi:flavin reductase (DIM6/NTAB) family NADH-FMN oxidoreductase RutF
MQLDPQTIGTEAMYKLMIGCVVPRPIAWVSSVDASGVANLAPFSYFMAITHDPPTIAFSASPRAEAGAARRTPCATSRPRVSSSSTWWTTRSPSR